MQAAGAYDAHAFDDLHEAHRGAGAAGCILLARFRPSRGAAAAVAAAAALAASSSDGGGGMDADGHQRVALKVASKALLEDTGEVQYVLNEAALLRSEAGRHPFIATLCGTFQTPDALVTVFQVRSFSVWCVRCVSVPTPHTIHRLVAVPVAGR